MEKNTEEELMRRMWNCLEQNGFTWQDIATFRNQKQGGAERIQTKNRDFINEVSRRLDAGQTRFTVNECKTYPNSPYQRDITNPAAEVRRVMMNLGLVSTRRGVYEVVA